jgi:Glycosyl hydrolases family 2
MKSGSIELTVAEVSNIEARVEARFCPAEGVGVGPGAPVVLKGLLRGPYCKRARTLLAEYPFRDAGDGSAAAVIPDPCLWSSEMPHLYHVELEALECETVIARCSGPIGLRGKSGSAGGT